MKKWTIFVTSVAIFVLILVSLSQIVKPKSTNPCDGCHNHTGRYQYLDILENDGRNQIPATIKIGETKSIVLVIENICNTASNTNLSDINVTLISGKGYFSVKNSSYNITTLPVGTAFVWWNITGISNGTDTILISATANNTHKTCLFSDSYSPPPSTIVGSGSVNEPPIVMIPFVGIIAVIIIQIKRTRRSPM